MAEKLTFRQAESKRSKSKPSQELWHNSANQPVGSVFSFFITPPTQHPCLVYLQNPILNFDRLVTPRRLLFTNPFDGRNQNNSDLTGRKWKQAFRCSSRWILKEKMRPLDHYLRLWQSAPRPSIVNQLSEATSTLFHLGSLIFRKNNQKVVRGLLISRLAETRDRIHPLKRLDSPTWDHRSPASAFRTDRRKEQCSSSCFNRYQPHLSNYRHRCSLLCISK